LFDEELPESDIISYIAKENSLCPLGVSGWLLLKLGVSTDVSENFYEAPQ